MSGPKISEAELARLRAEELERQRKERLRQIREATDRLNGEYGQLRELMRDIQKECLEYQYKLQSHEEARWIINKMSDESERCRRKAEDILQQNVPAEAKDILEMANQAKEALQLIRQEYYANTKQCKKSGDVFLKEENTIKNSGQYHDLCISIEDEDYDFQRYLCVITEHNQNELHELFREMEELLNCDAISKKRKKELHRFAQSIYEHVKNGKKLDLLIDGCKQVICELQMEREDFEEEYLRYYAAYVDYLEMINSYRKEKIGVVPKDRYQFDSSVELCEELRLLEKLSKRENEQKYIRSQIDEVMLLFGYRTTDEIVLHENQLGSHYIAKSENGSSAIHMHLSEDDNLMMEIVGISDREIESEGCETSMRITGTELSEEVQKTLLFEQENFCNMHPQIVRELEKRGVILKKGVYNQPDIKYVSAFASVLNKDKIVFDKGNLINTQQSDKHRVKRRKPMEMAIKE